MIIDRTIIRKPILLLALIAAACGTSQPSDAGNASPAASSSVSRAPSSLPAGPSGLTGDEASALSSLKLVDGFPLYTMEEHHSHDAGVGLEAPPVLAGDWDTGWACSLFAALADPNHRLYGRNFDWDYSPALLLNYFPDDGYSSVSMVDIGFLGYEGASARGLETASLADRQRLLGARLLPFDGMNEKGLVVAMAAVPTAVKAREPAKPSIGSIAVIREMLDHAANVDEAVTLFRSYDVDMTGGPPIHYLVADASGKAALLEFSNGELVVMPNAMPWHLATNFVMAEAGSDPTSSCLRYEKLSKKLAETGGALTPRAALDLLSAVSQDITQWSAVYDISTGDVLVALGGEYETVHTFHIAPRR